jgi:hypothetical protein
MVSGAEASLLPLLCHQNFISQTDSAVLVSTWSNNYTPAELGEPETFQVAKTELLSTSSQTSSVLTTFIRGTYRNR